MKIENRGKKTKASLVNKLGGESAYREYMRQKALLRKVESKISKEELARWVDGGLTQGEIAAQLGTTQPTISRSMKRYGL